MIATAFAALLAATSIQAETPQPSVTTDPPAVRLEDVEVVGRPLDRMIRDFVNEVAAPNAGRNIARWPGDVCVGVVNMERDGAEYIADRVSTVAADLGLKPGAAGCSPNVVVIATFEAEALSKTLIERHGRAFIMGGAGMDRGRAALRAFEHSQKPVRWWQLSMPVDSETGERATRIPGDCSNGCGSAADYAPVIAVDAASRLRTQIVDNIFRTIIIIDADKIGSVSAQQLADYVAMVTFAQINPDADTSGYASVLNVFNDPESSTGLTDWDHAYLRGLYDAERDRKGLRAGRTEIADSIRRARDAMRESSDQ